MSVKGKTNKKLPVSRQYPGSNKERKSPEFGGLSQSCKSTENVERTR
jgi:hypothetical protein